MGEETGLLKWLGAGGQTLLLLLAIAIHSASSSKSFSNFLGVGFCWVSGLQQGLQPQQLKMNNERIIQ
eukprot:5537179-Amphidinium_carterae.1